MSENIIKTTIQFKRDTTQNWETNKDVVPAEAEPCFDKNTHVLKIGDGTTTYENLPAIYATATHYQGTRQDGESDMDVIARVLSGATTATNKDDIFVVKTLIAGDKYSYTAYV